MDEESKGSGGRHHNENSDYQGDEIDRSMAWKGSIRLRKMRKKREIVKGANVPHEERTRGDGSQLKVAGTSRIRTWKEVKVGVQA